MSEFPTNKRLRVSDALREDACLTDVLVDASTDADSDWLRASQTTTTTELTAHGVVVDAVRSSNVVARGLVGDGGGGGGGGGNRSVGCATLVPIEELARAPPFETDRARSILARNALNDIALAAATAMTSTATSTTTTTKTTTSTTSTSAATSTATTLDTPLDSQGNFVTYVVAGIQTDEQEMLLTGERVPATVCCGFQSLLFF